MDTTTGELRRTWLAHPQVKIEGLQFSTAGDHLLSRSDGRGCRVWDVETGQLVADFPAWCAPTGRVLFAPDGQNLLVATGERLELINLATGAVAASLTIPSSFKSLAYAPDARHVAAGGHAGELWILDADNLQVRHRLTGHTDAVNSLVFSPSGQLLCSSSDDRSTWVWDWQQGQKRQLLSGSEGALEWLQFLPDGRSALGVAPDKTIRFWNVSTGRKTLDVRMGGIPRAVWLSPDGRRVYAILSNDHDGTGLVGYLPIASE